MHTFTCLKLQFARSTVIVQKHLYPRVFGSILTCPDPNLEANLKTCTEQQITKYELTKLIQAHS